MVSRNCRPGEPGRIGRSLQTPTPSTYLRPFVCIIIGNTQWMSPQEYTNNIYAVAHKTIGPTIWKQLKINLLYLACWNTAMSAQNLATFLAWVPFRPHRAQQPRHCKGKDTSGN
jgi:hypothetical protein